MGSNAVAESVPDAKKSRSKLASRKIPSKGKKKSMCLIYVLAHFLFSEIDNVFLTHFIFSYIQTM
jgi:hypothetical protein